MQNAEFRLLHRLDRFVLQHRSAKRPLDPHRAYASIWEEERDSQGALAPTAVVFLTNRECPFRCVMCDLWVNTLDETVPRGAIAAQIRDAVATLPPARHIKLYNAGSFFDPAAIPPDDDEEIAQAVTGFERVIVESHPAFLAGAYRERCLRFRDLIPGRLEVAVGLETAHPEVLERLNKKMTLDAFRRAADFLAEHDIALRVFVLLSPPFMPADHALEWACRSLDVAADVAPPSATVIPTRGGNGAMEAIGGCSSRHDCAGSSRTSNTGFRAAACACLPTSGTSSASSIATAPDIARRDWRSSIASNTPRYPSCAPAAVARSTKPGFPPLPCVLPFARRSSWPVELLERLAALTPRPRINLLLYYGVLGARSAWRSRLRSREPDTPVSRASPRLTWSRPPRRPSAAHELAVGGVDAAEFWLRRPRVSALRESARADRAHRRPEGDPAHPAPSRPAHRGARGPARAPPAVTARAIGAWYDADDVMAP